MIEIRPPEDCVNSPKNTLLQNLTGGWAAKDIDQIRPLLHDVFSWEIGEEIKNPILHPPTVTDCIQ